MTRLRLLALASLACLPLHAACSTSEEPASDSLDAVSCDGARFDHNGTCRLPNGQFAKESCCAIDVDPVSCDVVSVNYSVSELEEGFGSYYDIDSDGYSTSDEDAEDIDIDLDDDGKPYASIGHHSFSPDDDDDIIYKPASEEVPYRSWKIKTSYGDTYVVRVFSNELGVILYDDSQLGVLDCRGALDGDPEQPELSKMERCNIVDVNEELNANLLEEGLGSIYDIDDEGNFMADSDSRNASLESKAGQRVVRIGQGGFWETNGHTIDVEEDDERLTYTVHPNDSEEVWEVRLFKAANDAEIPGIGKVLYQENEDAEVQELATLDCRGIEEPREIDF